MSRIGTPSRLVERARSLAAGDARHILGITGPPGSGKSSLAEAIVAELGERAALVPMDGFHLSSSQLRRLGRSHRKGAPDTFDAAGYLALLRRLAANEEDTVFAPEFRRELEEAIAGSIAISSTTPLVVTEGNYLLLDEPPWRAARDLLTESWYLELDPATRIDRLVRRHVHYGKTRTEAEAWVRDSDEINAQRIEATRGRADVIVRMWSTDPSFGAAAAHHDRKQ